MGQPLNPRCGKNVFQCFWSDPKTVFECFSDNLTGILSLGTFFSPGTPAVPSVVVGPLNSLIKNGYDYITLTPSAKTLHTWLGSSPPCLPVKLALALHRAERARCLRDAPAQLYDCCCAQQIPTWRLLLPWIWCALEPPFSWQSECLSVAQSIPTRLLVAVGLCRSARSVLSAPEPRTPCTSVGGHLLC